MKLTLLWADDEIDLLKPHILFLKEKGYEVVAVQSGRDALDELEQQRVDIVFLDEQMPGLSGLDTLAVIKERWPQLPVVMITKSEEERLMEDALGGKISDYLVKPVNPSQILLTVKKLTERQRLQSEHSAVNYRQRFREIGEQLGSKLDWRQWRDLYRQLVYWEIELSGIHDEAMHDIYLTQKADANRQFCRFYEANYLGWVGGDGGRRSTADADRPPMSQTLLRDSLFPLLADGRPTFLLVIDNFRYDQWKFVQPAIEHWMRVVRDDLYYTILPTTTQYARNAMFAGLMPSEIERMYPHYWVGEEDEGNKNDYESELLAEQLRRHGIALKPTYHKVLNAQYGKRLVERLPELMRSHLNVVVYNFIDMLSHARTDSNIVRELAENEQGYRSLTLSWLQHSPLMELLQALAGREANIVLTTDHGSVRVSHPVKVRGDKEVSVNLRYKQGRLLDYNSREVFEVREPAKAFLPSRFVHNPYIFCRENDFFVYPNNLNQYAQYYGSTFQHGGISMEEVLVPIITMQPK